ncbi:protein-cysteine N-palmitoyltransferase Rasp [Myzus persicae]|uniref:protein-cysteine N-palmitoyltransferase Rasp n=1 Tax=Myzus persicae TaxID=13164 RepID=UPI000B930217|nr:protein-cysteine N-palmitoyltransferase Rasp [Myzus persicae]XP_022181694.1 protein-cysteine N-palmitoyltransferase Rasp [Myzus persicae]
MKKVENQYVPLHRFEIVCYIVIWASGIIYAAYNLLDVSFNLKNSEVPDLVPGWHWLGRRKDTCPEWRIWTTFLMYSLGPWVILHSSILLLTQHYFSKISTIRDVWFITVTSLCVAHNFGLLSVFIFFGLTLIYYCLLLFGNQFSIWITSILLLGVGSYNDSLFTIFDPSSDGEIAYLLLLTIYWHQLRCISFSLSSLDKAKSKTLPNCLHFLAYSFYLPCFFFGPIIIYKKINDENTNTTITPLSQRLSKLIINLIRYFFWMFFAEFMLHYVYINMFLQNIKVFKHFGISALSGFGFGMGQFFFIKYTFIYGTVITVARFDEFIEPPKPPKCISRIYLYSDMWRSFDRGLYNFLKEYIYRPSGYHSENVRLGTKLTRSFMCFAFIFIWHGLSWEVFLWTFFNFIGITLETVARVVGKTSCYFHYVKCNLSHPNERRFLALITSPLTMLSAISNFFFFGGIDAGLSFFEAIFLLNTWIENIIIIIIFYSMCQISIEFNHYKKSKKQ